MSVMNKGTAIVGFVLSFVTGASCMYAVEKNGSDGESAVNAEKSVGKDWNQDAKIPISSEDPSLGPKNAPVTVVICSDDQVPVLLEGRADDQATARALRLLEDARQDLLEPAAAVRRASIGPSAKRRSTPTSTSRRSNRT